jgi:hypothetical protein
LNFRSMTTSLGRVALLDVLRSLPESVKASPANACDGGALMARSLAGDFAAVASTGFAVAIAGAISARLGTAIQSQRVRRM